MATPAKTKSLITERTDGDDTFYDFRCPFTSGCGADDESGHVPFHSIGWADRDHAVARGKQHVAEHETGEVAPSLEEFRVAVGISQSNAGQTVKPEDWEL